jgi:hypothetical protein
LRRFLPRTLSAIDLVLSGDLGAFMREAACEKIFSYAKLIGDTTQRNQNQALALLARRRAKASKRISQKGIH